MSFAIYSPYLACAGTLAAGFETGAISHVERPLDTFLLLSAGPSGAAGVDKMIGAYGQAAAFGRRNVAQGLGQAIAEEIRNDADSWNEFLGRIGADARGRSNPLLTDHLNWPWRLEMSLPDLAEFAAQMFAGGGSPSASRPRKPSLFASGDSDLPAPLVRWKRLNDEEDDRIQGMARRIHQRETRGAAFPADFFSDVKMMTENWTEKELSDFFTFVPWWTLERWRGAHSTELDEALRLSLAVVRDQNLSIQHAYHFYTALIDSYQGIVTQDIVARNSTGTTRAVDAFALATHSREQSFPALVALANFHASFSEYGAAALAIKKARQYISTSKERNRLLEVEKDIARRFAREMGYEAISEVDWYTNVPPVWQSQMCDAIDSLTESLNVPGMRTQETYRAVPGNVVYRSLKGEVLPKHYLYLIDDKGVPLHEKLNGIRAMMMMRLRSFDWKPGQDVTEEMLSEMMKASDGSLPTVFKPSKRGLCFLQNGHHRIAALVTLIEDGLLPESVLDKSLPFEEIPITSEEIMSRFLAVQYVANGKEGTPVFSWVDVLNFRGWAPEDKSFAWTRGMRQNWDGVSAAADPKWISERQI